MRFAVGLNDPTRPNHWPDIRG